VLRLEIDEPGTNWEPVTQAALATFASLELWMRSEIPTLVRMAS